MRKIKKINGWLIVRFNDREKRIYEGCIGSFGVIDAELYTGKLEIDRGAMDYCDAGTQAEAEELARGLDSEETYEDTAEKYILVTEGNDGSTEEEVNPQVMIEGFTRTLESRIGSERFPDVDAGTARHELMGFKTALNRLGLLEEEDTAVEPEFFGTAKPPLPRGPEELLSYVCDCVCKHRCDNQEAQDALCESCQIGRLYEAAEGVELQRRGQALAHLEALAQKIADPETGEVEAGVIASAALSYIQAMENTGFIGTAEAKGYGAKTLAAVDSRSPADTFRHVPKNGKLTRRVYQLGLRMLESCPENDCTIYRNIFQQARELDDKIGFLEGYADQVMMRSLRKLYGDLEQMYLMSSAVRCYRAEQSEEDKSSSSGDSPWEFGKWVSRFVSEFGVALDGQLYSSEELLKHTGERVGVRKTTQGVEARINPSGERIGMLEPVDLNALGIRPYKITDIHSDDARLPYGLLDKVAERMLGADALLRGLGK
ncbi:MAG: hypothetical protein IJX04_07205 [Oscillospiraceae bacterium]|nr:hypothetical protein [Oscillospiraceae bacterium]